MAYDDEYFTSSEFKNILKKYEKENNGDHTSLYMESDELADIAEYYYKRGEPEKAASAINHALRLFPGAAAPLAFLSRTAMFNKHDLDLARKYAERIKDKHDLEYIYLCAEIMIMDEKANDADEYLHQCLNNIVSEDDQPDYILDVAALFMDYGLADKAQEWLSFSDESDLADYQEIKGRIASDKGDYAESSQIFESLLDDNPYSSQMWDNLAATQLKHNHIKDAITSSEFSIAINPNNENAILNKANALYRLGKYDEAAEYYKRFIHLCPSDVNGYVFLGDTFICMDRPVDAVEQYKKAEQMVYNDPEYLIDIYKEIANALSYLGEKTEAITYVEKAMQTEGCNKEELTVLKGRIYLENHDKDKANKYFLEAIENSDGNQTIYKMIAVSMHDCNYMYASYHMFRLILKNFGDTDKRIFIYLALCCKGLGRKEEFLENLKQACAADADIVRMLLGSLFPDDIEPDKYYEYALTHEV